MDPAEDRALAFPHQQRDYSEHDQYWDRRKVGFYTAARAGVALLVEGPELVYADSRYAELLTTHWRGPCSPIVVGSYQATPSADHEQQAALQVHQHRTQAFFLRVPGCLRASRLACDLVR